MRFTKNILIYLVLLTLCIACKQQMVDKPKMPSTISQVDGVDGVLLVKLKPNVADQLANIKDIVVTRSSQNSVVSELASLDNAKFRRLFPYAGRFEERTRKAGLHRWYKLNFNPDINLDSAFEKVQKIDGVEVVEVEHKLAPQDAMPQMVIPNAFSNNSVKTRASVIRDKDITLPFNDPLLKDQWYLNNNTSVNSEFVNGADLNVFEAWKITTGKPNVIVAVVDEGVDATHEDLHDNIWVNEAELNGQQGVDDDGNGYIDDIYGYNFADNSPTLTVGPKNHGTHVAGIIAAKSNNGIGISGIAGGDGSANSGARIMCCQSIGQDQSSNSAEAIKYAADMGAVICNNSWTSPIKSADRLAGYLKEAIDYFIDNAGCDEQGNQLPTSPMKGGLVIFAVGNDRVDRLVYPPAYERVLSVASAGPKLTAAWYTNKGNWVNITAFGGDALYGGENGDIVSCINPNASDAYGEKYAWKSGTSMAAPEVAGIAALVLSAKGGQGFTNEMLKQRLLTAVRPFDINKINPDLSGKLGVGYIDAARALDDNHNKAPQKSQLKVENTFIKSIALTWNVSSDEDDNTPSKYRLYYSTSPITDPQSTTYKDVSVLGKSVGDKVEYLLDNLSRDTRYYIGLQAVDRWGLTSDIVYAVASTQNNPPQISDFVSDTLKIGQNNTYSTDFTVEDKDNNKWIYSVSGDTKGVTVSRKDNNLNLIIRGYLPAGTYFVNILLKDEVGASSEYKINYKILKSKDTNNSTEKVDIVLFDKDLPKGINLDKYFGYDPSNPLTFTTDISNNSVAKIDLLNDFVKISPLSVGSTVLRIVAVDSKDKRREIIFNINVLKAKTNQGGDVFVYNVYPRPCRDRLYINVADDIKSLELVFEKYNGQVVRRGKISLNSNTASLNTSFLSPGIYKLTVISSKGKFITTIVRGA